MHEPSQLQRRRLAGEGCRFTRCDVNRYVATVWPEEEFAHSRLQTGSWWSHQHLQMSAAQSSICFGCCRQTLAHGICAVTHCIITRSKLFRIRISNMFKPSWPAYIRIRRPRIESATHKGQGVPQSAVVSGALR